MRRTSAGLKCGLSWLIVCLFTFICLTFALHQVTAATGGHPMPGQLYSMDVGTPLPVQMQALCQGERSRIRVHLNHTRCMAILCLHVA